ncbi:pep-cterm sorting domain-containing protein [Gigaspora margarita]|uniref:Pep-cterm sorting domain-containing protein n=1 Tax=Gigaspora margarita TaxID=4874 RepID=A0A8H4A3A3_GIGMA|nr:pep-cterm sorting domain-containing protein [Gigaspora margarita]
MSSTCVAESSSSTSLAPITVNSSVSTDVPIAITIPPEIFIKICEHLPPSDLLSLTGVCKRFRGFLCSPESLITQDIWRTSRIYFLPGLQLPPPEGMYEEEYIRFASLLTRCQYCTSQKMVKVYWQFQVRCCQECLLKNTTPIIYSKDHNWMTDNVFTGLVYVRHNNQILFWTSDLKSSYREFEVISGNHYMKWVADRKERRIRIMDDAVQRDQAAAAAEEESNKLLGSATADTTTNISTVSALGVDVDPRQFALSQIRITGTRSSVSSAVSALQHFGHIDTLDIMIMDSP